MKALLLLFTVGLLSSCGLTEGLSKNCGSSIEEGCNLIFGYKDKDQDKEIADNNTVDQRQYQELIARIITLETNKPVISVMDPCPTIDSISGYKEMLFELEDGTVIAYFENGSRHFLTELIEGVTYQTTDDRACQFTL